MMRRLSLWLGALALVVCAGSASAFTTDGNHTDFFSYSGSATSSQWNPAAVTLTSTAIRRFFDGNGTSPGGGGQDYDIEEVFYVWEDFDTSDFTSGGIIRVGIVTGFGPFGRNGSGGPHYAGDVFLDLGADSSLDVAVAVGMENTAENNFGARFGNAWGNTGWTTSQVNVTSHQSSADPYRVVEGAGGVSQYGPGNNGLGVAAAWGLMHNAITGPHTPGTERWFLELQVEIAGSQEVLINNGNGVGGLGLHWTMLCGNDVVDFSDTTPLAPVPEPASMVLLGMGVLGIALRARRPQC